MGEPWHEIVVESQRSGVFGFVEGFMVGRGSAAPINAEEEAFDVSGWRERLTEALSGVERTHVLVPGEAAGLFRDAVARAAEVGFDVKVLADRVVRSAEFDFRLHVFSREHARKIRDMLASLPSGAALTEDTHLHETVDPDAKGYEAYAPVHEFEFTGRGKVRGSIPSVHRVHRTCLDEPLIHTERIRLVP